MTGLSNALDCGPRHGLVDDKGDETSGLSSIATGCVCRYHRHSSPWHDPLGLLEQWRYHCDEMMH